MTGFVRRLHPRVDEQLARLIVAEAVLAAAEFAGHVEAAMLLEMVFDLFLTERQQHRADAVARAAAGEIHRLGIEPAQRIRSEERRGGQEGVSTCRSRWSPYH